MNINDLDKVTDELLKNRESQAIIGIAGGAKSSVLLKLSKFGYSHPAIYVPYAKLLNGHTDRFKGVLSKQGVDLIVKTYASGFEKQIFGKGHGYKAYPKPCSERDIADIIIFDEVFAMDRKLIKRAIKDVTDAGIPYIIMGDPYQSHREDKVIPMKVKDITVRVSEVDQSFRGEQAKNGNFTEAGLNCIRIIETLYQVAKQGLTLTYQQLAQLVYSNGGTVDKSLPIDDGQCVIGFIANAISDYYIATSGAEYKKEFVGKVEYTQKGELAKKFRDAPVVSQAKANQIRSFSDEVVATPATHMNANNCIGMEVKIGTDYHLIITTNVPYDRNAIYTLFSRMKTTDRLHLHILDELPTLTQFREIKSINKCKVYDKIHWCSSTLAELGLPESYRYQEIKVSPSLYKALEKKVTKPYMRGLDRIFVEGDTTFIKDRLGTELIKRKKYKTVDGKNVLLSIEETDVVVYEDEFSWYVIPNDPTLLVYPKFDGEAKEKIKSKASQVLAEIAKQAPDILYDPTETLLAECTEDVPVDINGEIVIRQHKVKTLIQSTELPIKPNFALSTVDVDILSESIELDTVLIPDENPTKYAIDFAASYWQQMVVNSFAIPCGMVIPFDRTAPISKFNAIINGTSRTVTTPILVAYGEKGCKIENVIPLCSYTKVFEPTDEIKEHIYKRRHIDFSKEEMNVFGAQERSRFKEYTMVIPEHKDDKGRIIPAKQEVVYVDEKETACLFGFIEDIKQIQALLTFLIAQAQNGKTEYGTDCIISDKPIIIPNDLPQGFRVQDYTLKEYVGVELVKSTRVYNEGTKILQGKLDKIVAKRKASKHAKTITKEEQDLIYVLDCWKIGISPDFSKLASGIRKEKRKVRKEKEKMVAKAEIGEIGNFTDDEVIAFLNKYTTKTKKKSKTSTSK